MLMTWTDIHDVDPKLQLIPVLAYSRPRVPFIVFPIHKNLTIICISDILGHYVKVGPHICSTV